MAGYLKITQTRSTIGRLANQKKVLFGLGIKRRGRTSYVEDTPSTRGMVGKVAHLVTVEEVTKAERNKALVKTKTPSYTVLEDGDA